MKARNSLADQFFEGADLLWSANLGAQVVLRSLWVCFKCCTPNPLRRVNADAFQTERALKIANAGLPS
jgi:hypothetical protein